VPHISITVCLIQPFGQHLRAAVPDRRRQLIAAAK
jgi:hypothetical protein